ncbi:hypothetical protein SLS53_001603 [Cytospora paraplurivora]|uniref:Geranylgeranyl pyrophosphate synthetase n=1 Tax=Cytospora paraplurivora TaxID=2898453 RepID=A0AAN9YM30_9PEZI
MSWPEAPLGTLLYSLNLSNFQNEAKKYVTESTITECKPAKWTPLPTARQLKPDSGQYVRDPNAARYPKHPVEPAITAVLAIDHENAQNVDIVACGSTLGNLLRFIRGEDRQFRMLVELVEGTIFFIRRESSPFIPDVKGYGHSFPEAYTTWEGEVKGSVSHQRVLSYRFGGLGFLLRFEGDGYLWDGDEVVRADGDHKSATVNDFNATQSVEELAAELNRSRVTGAQPTHGDNLKIIHAGNLVSQDRIFDLKTRSVRRKEADRFEDTFGEQLPRLWVSQIPRFILAYHKHGLFEEISIRDARSDVKSWERNHVDVLSRLAALLHRIVGLVRSRSDGRLELRHETVGTLEVREQPADSGDALSASVRCLWAKASAVKDDVTSAEMASDPEEDGNLFSWDEGSEPDYTACSSEDCGYCGRCSY